MFEQSFVQEILILYINGVAIEMISQYMGTYDIKLINQILDEYVPYLG